MVDEIKRKFSEPINLNLGKLISMVLILFIFFSSLLVGFIKFTFEQIILLPEKNRETINFLEKKILLLEENLCIMKQDFNELKEGQKELRNDIKELLKHSK